MHDQLGQVTFRSCPFYCSDITRTVTMQELSGGARFSILSGRVQPYVGINAGLVRVTNHAIARPVIEGVAQDYNPAETSTSVDKFAWVPNAGVSVKLSKHLDIGAEYAYLRLIGPTSFALRRYAFDQHRAIGFVLVRF